MAWLKVVRRAALTTCETYAASGISVNLLQAVRGLGNSCSPVSFACSFQKENQRMPFKKH